MATNKMQTLIFKFTMSCSFQKYIDYQISKKINESINYYITNLTGDGFDGNFQQLLLMKAEEDSNLAERLKRKENVYTSPEIKMR